jgi:hypothetical protein
MQKQKYQDEVFMILGSEKIYIWFFGKKPPPSYAHCENNV